MSCWAGVCACACAVRRRGSHPALDGSAILAAAGSKSRLKAPVQHCIALPRVPTSCSLKAFARHEPSEPSDEAPSVQNHLACTRRSRPPRVRPWGRSRPPPCSPLGPQPGLLEQAAECATAPAPRWAPTPRVKACSAGSPGDDLSALLAGRQRARALATSSLLRSCVGPVPVCLPESVPQPPPLQRACFTY